MKKISDNAEQDVKKTPALCCILEFRTLGSPCSLLKMSLTFKIIISTKIEVIEMYSLCSYQSRDSYYERQKGTVPLPRAPTAIFNGTT